jgi:DNA-binding transcriptional LysR family regulator
VRSACVAAGFEPDIAFVTRDVLAIRALVAAGLGVTLTPRLIAGHLHGVRVLQLRDDRSFHAHVGVAPVLSILRVAEPVVGNLEAVVTPLKSGRMFSVLT